MYINKCRKETTKSKACYSSTCFNTYHVILCNISYDYKHTFGFTQEVVQRYFEGWARRSSDTSKGKFMHGIVSLFIREMYNFVWNYKYAHEVYMCFRGTIVFPPSSLLLNKSPRLPSHQKIFGTEAGGFGVHLCYTYTWAKLFLSGWLAVSAEGWLRLFFVLCLKLTFSIWKHRVLRIFGNRCPQQ
jgi:hypothetical protein